MKSEVTAKDYQISVALPYAFVEDPVDFDPFDKSLTCAGFTSHPREFEA